MYLHMYCIYCFVYMLILACDIHSSSDCFDTLATHLMHVFHSICIVVINYKYIFNILNFRLVFYVKLNLHCVDVHYRLHFHSYS